MLLMTLETPTNAKVVGLTTGYRRRASPRPYQVRAGTGGTENQAFMMRLAWNLKQNLLPTANAFISGYGRELAKTGRKDHFKLGATLWMRRLATL